MTDRKKRAVGFGISAALFALVAGVFGFTEVNPDWLGNVLAIVAAVAGVVGITIVVPDKD